MFEKSWRFRSRCMSEEDTSFLSRKFNVPEYIIDILSKRGVCSDEDIESFLNPQLDRLTDPLMLKDMDAAVERILHSSDIGEKVTIYGDYDADGITSTSILYHFLTCFLDIDVDFYIPDRLSEGYGMSIEAIDYISLRGTSLIITVDCGIRNHEEIEYAKSKGIDVIVTDHHQCGETIPDCVACVNPTRPDCPFPYKNLAGVGVAFKLISALGFAIGLDKEIYEYMPIVAIGTIGDAVPLTGENRIYVKNGLEMLERGVWIGLSKLIELSNGKNGVNLTATYIAFNVVPKINAAGRMGEASRAVYLLLADDEDVAGSYAMELVSENARRQELEAKTLQEALLPENLKTKDEDSIVISVGKNWHHGVIGIVAARLMERFNKPAIVLAYEENSDNLVRGSARSVEGFNLYKGLSLAEDFLIKFGGHEMAAGLTMDVANIPKVIEILNEYAEKEAEESIRIPYLEIDGVVGHEDLTLENARLLKILEPYGQGNEVPVLCAANLKVVSCSKIGNDRHLRINFQTENGNIVQGVAFSKGPFCSIISSLECVSVAFRMEVNSYNNTESLSLIVEDVHDCGLNIEKSTENRYNNDYCISNSFTLTRRDMLLFYKVLKSLYKDGFRFYDLYNIRRILQSEGFNWYKLRKALDVFMELDLVRRDTKEIYTLNLNVEKVELDSSHLYKALNGES